MAGVNPKAWDDMAKLVQKFYTMPDAGMLFWTYCLIAFCNIYLPPPRLSHSFQPTK